MKLIFSLNGWNKTTVRIPNIIKIAQQFQDKAFLFKRKKTFCENIFHEKTGILKLSISKNKSSQISFYFFSVKDRISLSGQFYAY